MYDRILIAMALDHGLSPQMFDLARKLLNPGGELHAVHVIEATYGLGHPQEREFQDVVTDKAAALMKDKLAGHDDVKGHIVKGSIYRSIVKLAEEQSADCIITGSHKPGLADLVLGSNAERVVRHAPCAVHVFR